MPSINLDSGPINLCCCWVAGIQRKCVIALCKDLHACSEAENERHLQFRSTFYISSSVLLSCLGVHSKLQQIWSRVNQWFILTLLLPLGSIWPHSMFNVSKKMIDFIFFFASYFMTFPNSLGTTGKTSNSHDDMFSMSCTQLTHL